MVKNTTSQETKLVTGGRHPEDQHGVVNPPVYRASTVTFPTLAALNHASANPYEGVYYGRIGTPTTQALEEAVTLIEDGYRTVVLPSGLAAITTALMAFLKSGDHLLMVDNVYGPTRRFCDSVLASYGIETTYYDPMVGAAIATQIRPNTRVIFTEAPGSLTFEVQDIPAIAEAAHRKGVTVMMDNTWATPIFFPALKHGVDVSIHAATKYIVGHADAMLGTVTLAREEDWFNLKATASLIGHSAGTEECYLGLRGLRTLSVRLARHQESALAVARWLEKRPEVSRVLHPAFESCPGHENWKRDFSGSSGLFSVILREDYAEARLARMLDNLTHFAMGYSWGGFESLVLPARIRNNRTATEWDAPGTVLRFHIGLEAVDDLTRDLEAGFRRLAEA